MGDGDKLMTRQEAAAFLGLRPQTLATWAMTGKHLPLVKLGKSVRYKLCDVQAFIEKQTVPAAG